MHHSRLCAILIDCNARDLDEAARFVGAGARQAHRPAAPGKSANQW
jgi:hypothetical protein